MEMFEDQDKDNQTLPLIFENDYPLSTYEKDIPSTDINSWGYTEGLQSSNFSELEDSLQPILVDVKITDRDKQIKRSVRFISCGELAYSDLKESKEVINDKKKHVRRTVEDWIEIVRYWYNNNTRDPHHNRNNRFESEINTFLSRVMKSYVITENQVSNLYTITHGYFNPTKVGNTKRVVVGR
jgi:hypothetical protein